MSLEILLILFFIVILLSRILFSKNYRLYYLLTAFFSFRLWFAILGTLYYAGGNKYMDELVSYTTQSTNIILITFILGVLYMGLESLAMHKIVQVSYKTTKIQETPNIYNNLLLFFVLLFLIINTFLLIESLLVYDSDTNNKMVFVETTHFPYLYKALDQINLLVLLIISYSLSSYKYLCQKKQLFRFKYLIYGLFIIGFLLFTFRYMFLNIKTTYIAVFFLYFLVPSYFYHIRTKMLYFKNKTLQYFLIFLFSFTILFTFSLQYGNSFTEKIFTRIAWEGQLLYSSLDYFDKDLNSNSFIDNFPDNHNSRAMIYTMELFSPQNKLDQFYNTGWQMSSAMPAFNFLFDDYLIANLYWVLNWVLLIYLLIVGLKKYMQGFVMRSFIYFNISFLIGFYYLILGNNHLFSYRFWVLSIVLIFIEVITKINSKSSIKGTMQTNEGRK